MSGGGVVELAAGVRSGSLSSEVLVHEALARIDHAEGAGADGGGSGGGGGGLGAVREVHREAAAARARAIDAAVAGGKGGALGVLAGVPVLVKDNICHAPGDGGGRTSAGSRMLEGYESPYTATSVVRLLEAGAVVVGRTAMDEFAMGGSGEHWALESDWGVRGTRNPHDAGRVPGGSSSGSAAAVGAGLVTCALGSDTGGSIRQPAAHCGVVGFKPSYGRVSRWGLIAFASSLDQIGPLCTSVEDAALVSGVLCGFDTKDSTSSRSAAMDVDVKAPVRGVDGEGGGEGFTVGVVKEAMGAGLDASVRAGVERAARAVEDAGGRVVEVSVPSLELGIDAYYIVAPVEAASNLARYDGVRYGRRAELGEGEGLIDLYEKSRSEGFGDEVQRRIVLGTYAASAGYADKYYERALRVRRLIKDEVEGLFAGEGCVGKGGGEGGVDALMMPTTPGPAFGLGEKLSDPLEMYLEDLYTVVANLIGGCGISLPSGVAEVGGVQLPVGVQLMGPWGFDERVLRVAWRVEGGLV